MSAQFPTRQLTKLTGHNGAVHCVAYSAGLGQYILTGSTDRSVRLFNASRSTLVQTYSAHGHEVLDLAVASDNARFASCGGDKTVFLWDVATATTIRRFSGHAGKIEAVAFGGEEASVVVSGSFDGSVKVWDTKSNMAKPLMSMAEAKDGVTSVEVPSGGWDILSGSIDGRVRTYDVRMGRVVVDVIGHAVTSVAPTRQNDSLLVSSLDSTIRLMDKKDGKMLQSFKDSEYENARYRIRSVLGMKDAAVISGSESGQIFVWDLLNGNVMHKLRHAGDGKQTADGSARNTTKNDVISAVAYCPAREEWVSAGGDGSVVVWGMPD